MTIQREYTGADNRSMTVEQWREEGERLFGPDNMKWKFVCPVCKHAQSVQDYKDAGAPPDAIAFSCVGRWLPEPKRMLAFGNADTGPGPCNYTGGGLFQLNPIEVDFGENRKERFFDFAREEVSAS